MTVNKIKICGPCSNTVCYIGGCIRESKFGSNTIGSARLSDMMFCVSVLADQPLSTEEEHARIDAKDHVENLKQQVAEMGRIDEAIATARKVLGRPS